MALNSTLIRFKIDLSDVDRNLYRTIELRIAKHPSESGAFLLARVLAYVLNLQEGIELTEGISKPEDPAVCVRDLTGQIQLWIDIGNPSAKRIHKASKASKTLKIYTYRDPKILQLEATTNEIYRADQIELISLDPKFLSQLEDTLGRDNAWKVLHTEGEISITVGENTLHSELTHQRLS